MTQKDTTASVHPPQARLALEDGSIFTGTAFGHTAPQTIEGEVCFNTSLSGYQEILTDPSYAGQIVTMTNPLIGNYGVNEEDLESKKIQPVGFIVREKSNIISNYRANGSLDQWLKDSGVTAITGIDTRALTRKLRVQGALNGVLSTDSNLSDVQLVEKAKKLPGLIGRNLALDVSCESSSKWSSNLGQWKPLQGSHPQAGKRYNIIALDCGMKLNILRNLADVGLNVTVLPFDATPKQIAEHKPDGMFLSNGPGDPAAVLPTIKMLKQMAGKLPIFGICLGHQLLSLALGAKTFKMKFGHRGGNQPVQNLATQKVEITSQNHGFAVDIESLKAVGGEPTHINLNDQTLEGFRHRDMPLFCVQYHPEASPGPHDASYLFDCFINMLDTGKSPTAAQMDQAQRCRNTIKAA